MYNRIQTILVTISYLKPIQIWFQLWYRILPKKYKFRSYSNTYDELKKLHWKDEVSNLKTYYGEKKFVFINLEHQFSSKIDWNFNQYQKLWTYNLNYFDFLNQEDISKEQGLSLIYQFIEFYPNLQDGKESYPTSLRIINWTKFIAKHQIDDKRIIQIVREDANRLLKSLEFHLLGNHLLENAFALLFASILFNDKNYLNLTNKLLIQQLNEQILDDGAHFELSPMYHQLMFYRVLDCITLIRLNPSQDLQKLLLLLESKASKMWAWLENITFSNGSIPLFNDAANGINPNSESLFNYAIQLGFSSIELPLSASGYRKIKNNNYELALDIGHLGPDYQPGHAHADTFNFELFIKNKPVIVDSGTSTYNVCPIRSYERSTKAHNTVVLNNTNSSQVWSGFRLAKRAIVSDVLENSHSICASHNGYNLFGSKHTRNWLFSENTIIIKDSITNNKNGSAIAYFHFHPEINLIQAENKITIEECACIMFENVSEVKIIQYNYAEKFNKLVEAKCLQISFKESLTTKLVVS